MRKATPTDRPAPRGSRARAKRQEVPVALQNGRRGAPEAHFGPAGHAETKQEKECQKMSKIGAFSFWTPQGTSQNRTRYLYIQKRHLPRWGQEPTDRPTPEHQLRSLSTSFSAARPDYVYLQLTTRTFYQLHVLAIDYVHSQLQEYSAAGQR